MRARPEPSQEDILAVAAYVSERAGLSFAGHRGSQLLSAISGAMQRGGSPAGADYRSRLDRDRPEFDELVGRLTVGESYFFREPGQLEVLRREILPERRAGRDQRRALQLWSAGCSRGEEAYTLAIILEEAGVAPPARILATDLSTAALAIAEAGVYGRWALRTTTERQREAYFHPFEGGHRIDERFRRPVTFRRHNLLDPRPDMPPMDVIFCRNVLIYFEKAAVHRATEQLASSLAPGGWLVTGSSDPPLEVPGLEPVITSAGIVYRRTVAQCDPAWKRPAPQPVRELEPRRSPAGVPRGGSARTRPSPERAGQGPTSPPAEGGESTGSREAADRIRSLGDAGDIDVAAAAAGVAVEQFPLDVELRFLQAVLLLEAGRPAEAAAVARAALYLEPTLVMAHLTLARAEHALGYLGAARRSLRNAGSLLRALAADAVVPLSGGEPAGRLAAMVAVHLRATLGNGGDPGADEAR